VRRHTGGLPGWAQLTRTQQVARTQGTDAKSYQVRDDLSLETKGRHLLRFGGRLSARIRTYHYRNDKVIGFYPPPWTYSLDAAGAGSRSPAENRPTGLFSHRNNVFA